MPIIFNSERLIIRSLNLKDKDLFYEMMSDPEVMNPIPQPVHSRKQSDIQLKKLIASKSLKDKLIWAISEQKTDEFIGICGFTINSDGNPEIAYRFRKDFWGVGYGTEVARALLHHGFHKMDYIIIDADAHVENSRSNKILDKLMTKISIFWNESEQCVDFRYRIKKPKAE